MEHMLVEPTIFREYDIRGIVGETLNESVVERVGLTFATMLYEQGSETVAVIGGDARPSSAPYRKALSRGLAQGGIDVTDIGEVATPECYFASQHLKIPNSIVITGSHNPVEYNGLKLTQDYKPFAGKKIASLREKLGQAKPHEGAIGQIFARDDIHSAYMQAVCDDIRVERRIRVVVDCGNGITGAFAPLLFRNLGCEVISLFEDVDGTFPNHHPDPTLPKNLVDLIEAVRVHEADLGVAFDGDGDRLGVVTNSGEIIWLDRLLAFFATELLPKHQNSSVIFDVKCSNTLRPVIQKAGGNPIMWKTGHTHIKEKIQSENAILGAEFSGHICFCDRWYGFDDAPYAAARLIEALSQTTKTMDELFSQFPQQPATPELFLDVPDDEKFDLIRELQQSGNFDDGEISRLDGVRVDYPDGYGLVRASNTNPKLTLRFEGETREVVERIYGIFARELKRQDPSKKMPRLSYA